MTIEIGQLRRWVPKGEVDDHVFLVIRVNPPETNGDVFIDYIMDGENCWDDEVWIEHHSEVISEAR